MGGPAVTGAELIEAHPPTLPFQSRRDDPEFGDGASSKNRALCRRADG